MWTKQKPTPHGLVELLPLYPCMARRDGVLMFTKIVPIGVIQTGWGEFEIWPDDREAVNITLKKDGYIWLEPLAIDGFYIHLQGNEVWKSAIIRGISKQIVKFSHQYQVGQIRYSPLLMEAGAAAVLASKNHLAPIKVTKQGMLPVVIETTIDIGELLPVNIVYQYGRVTTDWNNNRYRSSMEELILEAINSAIDNVVKATLAIRTVDL